MTNDQEAAHFSVTTRLRALARARGRRWTLSSIFVLAVVVPCVTPTCAEASESSSDIRALRREGRQAATQLFRAAQFKISAEALPTVEWVSTFGVSFTNAEDESRTWLAPFDIQAQFTRSKTKVDLYADGYGYSHSGTDRLRGFSDPTLAVWQKAVDGSRDSLSVGGGITVAVHGDLGGEEGRQFVGVRYGHKFGQQWSALAAAKIVRVNGDLPSGTSRFGKIGMLQGAYTFPNSNDRRDLVLQLARSQRSGAGDSTSLALTHDFPMSKMLDGSIVFSHGTTTGQRDNSLEFDVSISF